MQTQSSLPASSRAHHGLCLLASMADLSCIPDDILVNVLNRLDHDPRDWARLACVCTRFSLVIRTICWKSKCLRTLPALVADLLPRPCLHPEQCGEPPGGWASLQKLVVCCPGLWHAGVLLESWDFGLDRELGWFEKGEEGSIDRANAVEGVNSDLKLESEINVGTRETQKECNDRNEETEAQQIESRAGFPVQGRKLVGSDDIEGCDFVAENKCSTVDVRSRKTEYNCTNSTDCDHSIHNENYVKFAAEKEWRDAGGKNVASNDVDCDTSRGKERKTEQSLKINNDGECDTLKGKQRETEEYHKTKKRQREHYHEQAHVAHGSWNLSREQGNKLLANRFRADRLYICDWPGCIHSGEKRKYKLFRGVFKNFKNSYVWRNLKDLKAKETKVGCAFCACKFTWDMVPTFCLKRSIEYHDDGEPVVRAYVCENGHVAGAWTDRPMYNL